GGGVGGWTCWKAEVGRSARLPARNDRACRCFYLIAGWERPCDPHIGVFPDGVTRCTGQKVPRLDADAAGIVALWAWHEQAKANEHQNKSRRRANQPRTVQPAGHRQEGREEDP